MKRTPLWFIIGIIVSVLIVIVLGVLTMIATGKIEGQGGVNQQAIAAAVTAHTEHTATNIAQPSSQPSTIPDMTYANGQKLNLNLSELEFASSYTDAGAFATNDNWQQVEASYKQKLQQVGYIIKTGNSVSCETTICNDAKAIVATNASWQVGVVVYGPTTWKALSGGNEDTNIPSNLFKQLSPNQVLILYTVNSLSNMPSATATAIPTGSRPTTAVQPTASLNYESSISPSNTASH